MSRPDDADEREDGDEPAQPRPARGRQVQARLQGLDRRDATGAARRLDGGGERHRRGRWRAPRGHRRRSRPAPPSGTEPTVRTQAAMPAARAAPSATPEHRPDDADGRWPGRGCTRSAGRATRRPPAAGPSSRTRSTTVIDSVLKIRKAPANRAMAPMSAVVAAKSPVEARIEAPRSCGEDRTYGSSSRRRLEGIRDRCRRRPVVESDVDPGEPVRAEDRLGGLERNDDGPAATAGPRSVAGEDADDAQVDGRIDGRDADRRRRRARPSSRASVALTSASLGPGVTSADPVAQREVVEARFGLRVDARRSSPAAATGRPGAKRSGAEVRPALERRARRRPRRACPRSCRASCSDRPISPNAATRRSARPTMRARRRGRRRRRCRRSWRGPAKSTATPSATPAAVRPVRSGRARRPRQASPLRPRT